MKVINLILIVKAVFYLLVTSFFINSNYTDNETTTNNDEQNHFFKDFIEIKKKNIDFNKVKYIVYGDSLSFRNWIAESGVDTTSLIKHFDVRYKEFKNSVAFKKPATFSTYKDFKFDDFDRRKKKNPRLRFEDYLATHFKSCELLFINFLVFNKEKNKAIICHALDCTGGFIEVYSKKGNTWILYKTIAQTT